MPLIAIAPTFTPRQTPHILQKPSLLCDLGLDLLSLYWHTQTDLLNDRGTREQTLLLLLCRSTRVDSISLCSPSPLLQKSVPCVRQNAHLPVFNAVQPVPEGCANSGVDWVSPESLFVEEGAHFDTELP